MLGGSSLLVLYGVTLLHRGGRFCRRPAAVGRAVGPLQVHLEPSLHARVPVVLDVVVGSIFFRNEAGGRAKRSGETADATFTLFRDVTPPGHVSLAF